MRRSSVTKPSARRRWPGSRSAAACSTSATASRTTAGWTCSPVCSRAPSSRRCSASRMRRVVYRSVPCGTASELAVRPGQLGLRRLDGRCDDPQTLGGPGCRRVHRVDQLLPLRGRRGWEGPGSGVRSRRAGSTGTRSTRSALEDGDRVAGDGRDVDVACRRDRLARRRCGPVSRPRPRRRAAAGRVLATRPAARRTVAVPACPRGSPGWPAGPAAAGRRGARRGRARPGTRGAVRVAVLDLGASPGEGLDQRHRHAGDLAHRPLIAARCRRARRTEPRAPAQVVLEPGVVPLRRGDRGRVQRAGVQRPPPDPSAVDHAHTLFATATWVCRSGSPRRDSRWSNAAATSPWCRPARPPAPMRVNAALRSSQPIASATASWCASSTAGGRCRAERPQQRHRLDRREHQVEAGHRPPRLVGGERDTEPPGARASSSDAPAARRLRPAGPRPGGQPCRTAPASAPRPPHRRGRDVRRRRRPTGPAGYRSRCSSPPATARPAAGRRRRPAGSGRCSRRRRSACAPSSRPTHHPQTTSMIVCHR